MPFKYIGRTTDFKGKSLWEIVGNLKNFGVGRIVTRSRFERYPEKSFMKILKVEPLANPENPSLDDSRKAKIWVERTFRGKTHPTSILMESVTYKPDYRLIPKDEEEAFCKMPEQSQDMKILPRVMEFPPLMRELMIRESKSPNGPKKEDLELPIAYNKRSVFLKYKIAQEGQTPTENITMGLGKPVADRLYKGLEL